MASGEGAGEGWEAAVRAEVGAVAWWEDPDSADLRARFKAFTGQRSDWPQPTVLFWKDLLLRVARRLRVCSAPAHLVTSAWFARPGGLTPLCLPQVLEEMRADGDILLKSELIDPSSGSLHQLVRRVSLMTIGSRRTVSQEDILVFKLLVEERAADIARQLGDSHWTSTCVVTISKFNSFFVDREDAHVALCFLTQSGKARYLSGRKQEPIEGVKFALTASQVPAVSKLDHDTLHLVWTEEKLQGQLDVLDRRWEISRRRALASFKSGDKQAAYRYVRQSKLFSQSRSRCTQLLERIEEVISLIASAESNKKVYEAIQIGILAMKDNNVSIDEVSIHMKEVDELVAAQREVEAALESVPLQSLDGEGDIEEEFNKLEAELQDDIPHIHVQEPMAPSNKESPDEVVESLSHNMSRIRLEPI
ncbi:hypothetical protein BDA96_03G142900 [Sorghum bicolor]|uniref:Charged multivesicular body protein 7 n=2 Tax=Sorghum bicolor TaxID=4558 RepID=C5XHY8_SORBI|nr:uncharacterized protein LOC8078134 isoform X2 [Sorghum bicolor]EES00603.1 hypothetical protein SORBI_3003G136800 [Sorghum bicolor]KAG0537364.1 hypothetical protein BDA96_03G142900 [Sorghum bicolor]|eukprot:XP_002455483.1 uncharacterized protein LOC8078134 isoform X2 [Sorghum bicolor]